MCGIVGIYNFEKSHSVNKEELQSIRERLIHRGPDDYGYFIDNNVGLAHRRLSIIDLSGGVQPMQLSGYPITISYNGEIYNYLELKEELEAKGHQFVTRSDTEVILISYLQWGTDCVKRFNGMWAFAIYDARDSKAVLFCSRDRMGIKPFYYLIDKSRFVFASELKAFDSMQNFSRRYDNQMLWDSLIYGPNPFGKSVVENIQKLGPGCNMIIQGRDIRQEVYFDLFDTFQDKDDAANVEELSALLQDAVSLRLRSDVPLATINSGGMDSSLLSSMSSEMIKNLHTYSVAPEQGPEGQILDGDESAYAEILSNQLGTIHQTVRYSPDSFIKEFEEAVYYNDGELFHSNSIPMKLLFRKIKEDGITVVLGGEGADEIFRGYYTNSILHLLKYIPASLGRVIMAQKYKNRSHLMGFHTDVQRIVPYIRNNFMSHDKADKILGIKGEVGESRLNLIRRMEELEPANALTYYEQLTYLNGLLRRADRMAMAHNIELRVPFLDHRLIIKLNGMRPWLKTGNYIYTEKKILKSISEPYLPKSIIKRKKYGFASPLLSYKPQLEDMLQQKGISASGLEMSELWMLNALTVD